MTSLPVLGAPLEQAHLLERVPVVANSTSEVASPSVGPEARFTPPKSPVKEPPSSSKVPEEPLFLPSDDEDEEQVLVTPIKFQASNGGEEGRPMIEAPFRSGESGELPADSQAPENQKERPDVGDIVDRVSVDSFDDLILIGDEPSVQQAAIPTQGQHDDPERNHDEEAYWQKLAEQVEGPFDDAQQGEVVLGSMTEALVANQDWIAEGRKRKRQEEEERRQARRRLRRRQSPEATANPSVRNTLSPLRPVSRQASSPPDDEIEFVGHRQVTPSAPRAIGGGLVIGSLATTDPWRCWTRRELRAFRSFYLKQGLERYPDEVEGQDRTIRGGSKPPFNIIQDTMNRELPPVASEPQWYKDVLIRTYERDVALQEERILREEREGEQAAGQGTPMAKLKLMLFREMSRYGTERFNPSAQTNRRGPTIDDEAQEAEMNAAKARARWIELWEKCPRVVVSGVAAAGPSVGQAADGGAAGGPMAASDDETPPAGSSGNHSHVDAGDVQAQSRRRQQQAEEVALRPEDLPGIWNSMYHSIVTARFACQEEAF